MVPGEKDDEIRREPEEQKGFLERIGDFLSQPLPGTAPRQPEPEPLPEIQAAPPAAAPPKPAAPPAAAAPKPTPMPAGPPVAAAPKPAAPKPAAPPAAAPPRPDPVVAPANPPPQPLPNMPLGPNPSGGGGALVPQTPGFADAANPPAPAPAYPVDKADGLHEYQAPDGVDSHRPYVSEIQKQTGVSGGETTKVPPGTLAAGVSAYVRREGGMPLRLHEEPGTSKDTIIARLPIGTQVSLIDGPQRADGYDWWHIRVADGRTGWVAGSELTTESE